MNFTPLNYALKLLEKQDRSVGNVKQKMKEKKFTPTEIDETIKTLIEKNFLDDERYAKNLIKSKKTYQHLGNRRLKFELKKKFISDELITKLFSQESEKVELETAQEAAEKWLRIKGDKENAREKLFRHLASKGFDYEIIKEVIDNLSVKY